MWLNLPMVIEPKLFVAKICSGFKYAPDVVEYANCFRALPVVAKICRAFESVTDVVELARGFRAEPVVA